MKYHDWDGRPEREFATVLRQLDPTVPTAAELAELKRKIVSRAAPLLKARRRPSTWWEYAAAWWGALLPLGVAASAVAAACVFWVTQRASPPPPATPRVAERVALLRAVTSGSPSRELVDLVLAPRTEPESMQPIGTEAPR